MDSKAVVIVNKGNDWYHDITLNYTQLSIDHSVSSRYSQSDYSYYVTQDFDPDKFKQHDLVLVIDSGELLLWGRYEKNVMPYIKNNEYTIINEHAYVWQPYGDGRVSLDLQVEHVYSDTVDDFLSTHAGAVTGLVDDSNISYLMHYELPVYGGVSHQMDWAITVSSGYFINGLLHHHGFHSNTVVHHIDISKISLATRQYTIENWNGQDIQGWIQHLQSLYPSMELFNRNKFTQHDHEYMDIWNDLQRQFGDDWQSHWDKYQALNHKYHRLNISNLNDVKNLLDKMPSQNGVIWWNGALKRMPSNLIKDSAASHKYAISFVKEIATRYPSAVCYGSDHCLQQYNGLDASVVLKLVQQENSREKLWQKI